MWSCNIGQLDQEFTFLCFLMIWPGNWPEKGPPPGPQHTGWPWTRAWVRCISSSSAAPTEQSYSPGWWGPAPVRAPRSQPGRGQGLSPRDGAACEAWCCNHSQGRCRRRIPRCVSCWWSSGTTGRGCFFLRLPEMTGLSHPSLIARQNFPFLEDKRRR